MMSSNWSGRRVLILGAARKGLALARWLSIHGAKVTLSDKGSADDLLEDLSGPSNVFSLDQPVYKRLDKFIYGKEKTS